jgi:putative DNA primase/helicase
LGDIKQKDVVDQMTGKWIIELSELASIRGRENEAVKSFFSRQVDRVRMSYGRRAEDYPRQSIFVGSTNASEYFTDETGNRRFWPVRVSQVNRQWLRDNRDQLWAEARVRYGLGEQLYFSKEIEAHAIREQEKRFDVDDWESDIKTIIAGDPHGVFVTTKLWRAIHITNGNGHPNMVDSKRIGRIMRRLGFVRRVRKIDRIDGKCWVRE